MLYKGLDPLTGAIERAGFSDLLKTAMSAEDGSPATLALVDIDRFLRINQQWGHAAGDAVLKRVAGVLSAMPHAQVIRYGGDEFAVIFPGQERERVLMNLEKARAEIESTEMVEVDGKSLSLSITLSAGAAAFPIDGTNEAELLRKADGALYRAKLGGRNKVMLACEERMAPKTTHFPVTQLERLTDLARDQGVGEAVLLREALDDLLVKYLHGFRREG